MPNECRHVRNPFAGHGQRPNCINKNAFLVMYSGGVDRQRMHRLGKKLIALSRQVNLEPHDEVSNSAERLVLGDVALYPRSTISEIVERTGFTQGYVSKCVAGLVEQDLVTTTIDNADRRRTLVAPTPRLLRAVQRRTLPIDVLLKHTLSADDDPHEVLAMLEELADVLLP